MNKPIAMAMLLACSAATGALAQSSSDEQACTNDAFQFCQYAIPDRSRVFACLVENGRVLSPACHFVMAQYLPPDPPPSKKPPPKKTANKGKGPLNLTPP
jgi:hypothetical protein